MTNIGYLFHKQCVCVFQNAESLVFWVKRTRCHMLQRLVLGRFKPVACNGNLRLVWGGQGVTCYGVLGLGAKLSHVTVSCVWR